MSTAEVMPRRNIITHDRLIDKPIPVYTVLLGVAACAVCALPHASQWLQYDRAAIAHGQLWRIITCHWTHFGWNHLAWDVAAFIGLGLFCERNNRKGFLLCLLLATLGIPLSVWALQPDMAVYRGLSGIDSALFCYGAMMFLLDSLREERRPVAIVAFVALVLFLAKTGYEYLTEATLFVQSGQCFVPVPLAHLVGGLTGAITALLGQCSVGRCCNAVLDNFSVHIHYVNDWPRK